MSDSEKPVSGPEQPPGPGPNPLGGSDWQEKIVPMLARVEEWLMRPPGRWMGLITTGIVLVGMAFLLLLGRLF